MAYAIFYDLETSDQHCIGQIINFAFVAYDENWQQVDQLTGNVVVSRLQLPRSGAILANRTNLVAHQQQTRLKEPQALRSITEFIAKISKQSNAIPYLIGYNSSGFDLKYLRTSMIRNGINPYQPKVIHRDLLLLSRYLAVVNQDFLKVVDAEHAEKFSLSLQNLCQRFGLLTGLQKHESLADVKLTADLAKLYLDNYKADIRNFEGYLVDSGIERGQLAIRLEPDYKGQVGSRIKETSYMFLAENDKSALWVDLKRYQAGQGRKSIVYRRKQCGDLLIRFGQASSEDLALQTRALCDFAEINCANFFKPSNCDIEQDIYRVDFDGIDALNAAIWSDDLTKMQQVSKRSRDAKILYLRYMLNTYQWGSADDDKIKSMLIQYAEYRYGGKLQLAMYLDADQSEEWSEDTRQEKFHPSYKQMLTELEEKRINAEQEDLRLLTSLAEFYQESEIVRIAGLG